MNWGNAFVRSKSIAPSGSVSAIEMELNAGGDYRKTSKKVTWLTPAPDFPLVAATLIDYDYLITKKKLEENDKLEDVLTPVTEFREEAWADVNVASLQEGDIIQLERKGYYILDRVHGAGSTLRVDFVRIPDGRAASLASKAASMGKPASRVGMYVVQPVQDPDLVPDSQTSMYRVQNVYSQ